MSADNNKSEALQKEIARLREELNRCKKSEQHLLKALSLSPMALCHHDKELRYTWLYNAHMGFLDQEVIGKTDWDIFDPHLAERMTHIKRRVLETGIGERVELPTIQGDPNSEYFDMVIEPLRDESNGEIIGLSCSGIDVTEDRRRREAYRASEESLRFIFNTSPTPITVLARDSGTDLFHNPAAERFFNTNACPKNEDVLARLGIKERLLEQLEQEETEFQFNIDFLNHQGESHHLSISAIPIFYQGKAAILITAQDLTERQQIEAQLRNFNNELEQRIAQRTKALTHSNKALKKAKENAEKASQRKTEFLRMVSHELRTPLHSISASVSQWQISLPSKEQLEIFQDINYGTSRLCHQIDDLVLMAETEDDQITAENYPFSILPLLDKLARETRQLITSDAVQFHYSKAAELPHGFYGDAYLINHLLRTVLENACKFTDQGDINFQIDWNPNSQTLNISVADSGCGMSDEQQQVIFDGFIQISRGLTRRSEGLGLGLTLCHRLSQLLNATLAINSQPGEGTEIQFQIPLKPLPAADTPAQYSQYKGPVLIVEDNIVNARVLERIITRLGHPVELAYSGLEALAAIDKRRFSVILMDIQMPKMDGITATAKIRQRSIHTPIIAVTANSDAEVRQHCHQAGMNDLLVKPVKPAEIQKALSEWQLLQPSSSGGPSVH